MRAQQRADVSLAMLAESSFRRSERRDRSYTNQYLTTFEYEIGVETLLQNKGNMVTIPLTVRLALCKLAQSSAQGSAREEILRALSISPRYKNCQAEVRAITNLLRVFTVMLINKIYLNDTRDLNPRFLDNSSSRFGVHVQKMNFGRRNFATAYINRWFELVSLRRLTDVLDPREVNASTSILLLSAGHIKTTWQQNFNILQTKTMWFRKLDGSFAEIPMMKTTGEFMYYHDEKSLFQIVKLPLLTYGITMTIVLSDIKSNFRRMLEGLLNFPHILQNARHKMKFTVLDVLVPRFKIKSSFTWDSALKEAGVLQVFNSTHSGLNNILKSNYAVRNMFLNKVKQKAVLDMDEMGAYRTVIRKEASDELKERYPRLGQRNRTEFKANYPFLFTIDLQISTAGDQTLFAAGAYYGPESDAA